MVGVVGLLLAGVVCLMMVVGDGLLDDGGLLDVGVGWWMVVKNCCRILSMVE